MNYRIKHRCWSALMALVMFTPAAAAQQVSKPLPIGVADAAGKIGYIPAASGGVEAIDLDTGKVLWANKDAGKPVAVGGKQLATQTGVADKANSLRIVVLDITDKGKQLSMSDTVMFPDWVSVAPTYGRTFSAEGNIEDGTLLLKWKANAFYAGGAPPPPEVVEAAKKEATGVARVDLANGKVTMLPADKAPVGPKVKLPDSLAKTMSQQYWTGSDWKTDLFIVGKTVSAISVKEAGGIGEMALKRWDLETGNPLETVELLRGKALWPQRSVDGGYLFVHQGVVKEQLPPGDYAWWVFSLESGKQVGKFPFESVLNNVVVIGSRAYYLVGGPAKFQPVPAVQPRFLRAIDLMSGKTLWERPVEGEKLLPPLP